MKKTPLLCIIKQLKFLTVPQCCGCHEYFWTIYSPLTFFVTEWDCVILFLPSPSIEL